MIQRLIISSLLFLGSTMESVQGFRVVAEGSVARERVDPIFLRCDVPSLGQEDEMVRVTWRQRVKGQGQWNDIFTADLTNDFPSYFFLSLWAGRGQYNPISLAAVMLPPVYVTKDTAGIYRCDVETAMSRGYADVTVDVLFGPRTSITIIPSGRVERKEGEELVLSCHAQCNPACSYRWYLSGRRISSSSSLQMTSLSRSDGGLYACQARNEAGRSIKPVEIRVQYSPRILALTPLTSNGSRTDVGTIDKSQKPKSGLILECRTEAWPAPEIQWFKGSTLIQSTPSISISTSTVDIQHKISRLTVDNATCLDNGIYSCKAHNSIGESELRSTNITKNCPPFDVSDSELCPFSSSLNNIKQERIEIEKKFGEEVSFHFCFSGHPKPTVEVNRKNGGDQKANDVNMVCKDETKICSVVISFVLNNPLQYGRYEVNVANNLQSFTKVYDVISRQQPLSPQNITIVTVTSSSVCLSWKPNFDGGSKQVFNLTYIRLDVDNDKLDDDKGKKQSLIVEENSSPLENGSNKFTTRLNSLTNNYNASLFSNISQINDQTFQSNIDSKKAHSSVLQGCLDNLNHSSFYSLYISAVNIYGKSTAPDVMIFKTLTVTTTTATTTTISTTVKPIITKEGNSKIIIDTDDTGSSQTAHVRNKHIPSPRKNHPLHDLFPGIPSNVYKSIFNTFDDELEQNPILTDDDNEENINSENTFDFDDDDNDDDFDSEDGDLFRILFPYFDDIFKVNRSTNTLYINEKSFTKKPLRPFKIGRYFKRYVQVEKRKHIAIPDGTLLPPRTTDFASSSYETEDGKDAPTFGLSTTSPIDGSFATITSASISATVLVSVCLIGALVALHLRRKRVCLHGRRTQNNISFKNRTIHSQPNREIQSMTQRTFTSPPSGSNHNSSQPKPTRIQAVSKESSITTSISHIQTNTVQSKRTSTTSSTSIKCRPRLSTPKLPQKNHNSCYSNVTTASSSKINPNAPPPSVPLPSPVPKATPIFQIPGIFVNDKRVSSHSYLEICSYNNDSGDQICPHKLVPSYADTLPISGMKHSGQSRRSSYSSVILPVDTETPDKLEVNNKCNSYLDLCEVLSAKSGSRSPSNIYDPLDLYEKSSIRSGGSYMGPNSPELNKKILDVNSFQYFSNQITREQQLQQQQQRSPKQMVNLLLQKQLCLEQSDNPLHYEECVSLVYEKDEMTKRGKCKTNNVAKKDRNGTGNQEVSETSMERDNHTNERLSNKANGIISASDVQNIISVYNEINSNSKDDEKLFGTNKTDHDGNIQIEGNASLGCENGLSAPVYYKNSSRLKTNSPYSTVKQYKNSAKFQNGNNGDTVSKHSITHSDIEHCRVWKNCGKNSNKNPAKPKKMEELSRKPSCHYYSDIDSNLEEQHNDRHLERSLDTPADGSTRKSEYQNQNGEHLRKK